jgi:hypothetical protein
VGQVKNTVREVTGEKQQKRGTGIKLLVRPWKPCLLTWRVGAPSGLGVGMIKGERVRIDSRVERGMTSQAELTLRNNTTL